ncbi:Hypothetical_protein [Hexamita inflata]|uniref:Hypothetical_protein n=1 Tax=Hexamita inflata TaxID=28002 RepID=A0AA86QIN8_9EUKA|nr:Hypothetical protein HINF_LOCUS46648 [Hexamita inflata]
MCRRIECVYGPAHDLLFRIVSHTTYHEAPAVLGSSLYTASCRLISILPPFEVELLFVYGKWCRRSPSRSVPSQVAVSHGQRCSREDPRDISFDFRHVLEASYIWNLHRRVTYKLQMNLLLKRAIESLQQSSNIINRNYNTKQKQKIYKQQIQIIMDI